MSVILGIESSCDETAASIVIDGCEVRSNAIASQIAKHAVHGGVVPELAAREHLTAIDHIVSQALSDADITIKDVDAIAVTNGPGLMPALVVGLNFARGLAVANNLPLIGSNHFLAHIYGAYLDNSEFLQNREEYPIISLVVSGGHTSLVLIEENGTTTIVGGTIDDAAGEAFDKGAKLLGLGYPGGPIVEKTGALGNPAKFAFPRPLTGEGGKRVSEENRFNFSFSGVKTALLYHVKREREAGSLEENFNDTVASYQEAIVDVLTRKTLKAAERYNAKTIVLAGGVACNGVLRNRFEEKFNDYNLRLAPRKYCTDNAAMVAGIGFHYLKKHDYTDYNIDAYARLPHITTVPFAQSE